MDKYISYCGFDCNECPVYVATINEDSDLRKKTAIEWGEMYKRSFSDEDIVCYGCKSDKLFVLCAKCDFKDCSIEKGIEKCDDCHSYPCDRIKKFNNWIDDNGNTVKGE